MKRARSYLGAGLLAGVVTALACMDGGDPTAPSVVETHGGVAAPAAAGATIARPAEPAGLALLTERRFDSKARSSDDLAGSEGWRTQERSWTNLRIVDDASAPASPSRVAEAVFPAGFAGGSPIVAERALEGDPRTLYLQLFVRLSPNWQGHRKGFNDALVLWTGGQPLAKLGAYGAGLDPLRATVALTSASPDRRTSLAPNLGAAGTVQRGVWQRWEVVLLMNSAGAANGAVHWWIDGVKVLEQSDVAFAGGADPSWGMLQWRPAWGWEGSDRVRQEMWMRFDHIYVSGSAARVPVGGGASRRVVLSPRELRLEAGELGTIAAAVTDVAGKPLPEHPAWSSSDSTVAVPFEGGEVEGVTPGTAFVVAAIGGARDSVRVVVRPAVPASIVVHPDAPTLRIGEQLRLAAEVRRADGRPLPDAVVQWRALEPSIATVDASGLLRAVAEGTTRVLASSGTVSDTVPVRVERVPVHRVEVRPASVELLPEGRATLAAIATDDRGLPIIGREVQWRSADPSVATVTAVGIVVARAPGETRVIATVDGHEGSAVVRVTAHEPPPPPPPPPSGSEPRPAAGSTIVFEDDFESYTSCQSMRVPNGGKWDVGRSCDQGVLSPAANTGRSASGGVAGRAVQFDWPESSSEQHSPLEPKFRATPGNGRAVYISYYYRAPGFVYAGPSPRVGKKHFLINLGYDSRISLCVGRAIEGVAQFEWNHLQSNGVKLDLAQNHDPFGSGLGTVDRLTDGGWHRITIKRVSESSAGAMNGSFEVWLDGEKIIERTGVGTGSDGVRTLLLAGTFNGGSSTRQQEYYDDLVVWY